MNQIEKKIWFRALTKDTWRRFRLIRLRWRPTDGINCSSLTTSGLSQVSVPKYERSFHGGNFNGIIIKYINTLTVINRRKRSSI